jgi:hypothetical protein
MYSEVVTRALIYSSHEVQKGILALLVSSFKTVVTKVEVETEEEEEEELEEMEDAVEEEVDDAVNEVDASKSLAINLKPRLEDFEGEGGTIVVLL